MAVRPNDRSSYGSGGLTAAQVKERFDALSLLLIARYNALIDSVRGHYENGISAEIQTSIEDKTLEDIFRDIESGAFAGYLKSYSGSGELSDLQSILNELHELTNIAQNEADNAKDLATVAQETADRALALAGQGGGGGDTPAPPAGGDVVDTVAREMAQQAINDADRAFKNSDTALETADIAYMKAESAQNTADDADNLARQAYDLASNAGSGGGANLTWNYPNATYYYYDAFDSDKAYVVFDIGFITSLRPTYVLLGNTGEHSGTYVLMGSGEGLMTRPYEVKPIATDNVYGSRDGVELWWEPSFSGDFCTNSDRDENDMTYVNHNYVLVLKLTGGNWPDFYHMEYAR